MGFFQKVRQAVVPTTEEKFRVAVSKQGKLTPKEKIYRKLVKQEYDKQINKEAQQKAQAVFKRPSFLQRIGSPAQQYQKQVAYSSALRKPFITRAKGQGRPKGTLKYSIPGIGPVGIREYRKYVNNQLSIQRIRAQQQTMQNMDRSREYNRRQMAAQVPRENRTIPDTTGFIPLGSIHKEIDDAANMVP